MSLNQETIDHSTGMQTLSNLIQVTDHRLIQGRREPMYVLGPTTSIYSSSACYPHLQPDSCLLLCLP